MHRLLSYAVALAAACALTLLPAPAQAGGAGVEKAQRRLNQLDCNAGPVDGQLARWTRSAIVRFQSRHHLAQNAKLTRATRQRLFADGARQCDRRPVPARTGHGRRVVISQGQNWVWLVGPQGKVVDQGGMIDLPSELSRGWHRSGSYCGRAARIKRNTTANRAVWLHNFVRFAPCGIGFHRVPTYRSNGNQIHPNWYLGTNFARSHGCIRLSKSLSLRLWRFTTSRTRVRVV